MNQNKNNIMKRWLTENKSLRKWTFSVIKCCD